MRHFSLFAKTGWENQSNTAGVWRVVPQSSATGATGTNPVNGRNGTPSYLTLAAPDKQNFSTVFVNDSESVKTYQLQTTNMAFAANPSLELWETKAAEAGKAFNVNYMQYRCSASAGASGGYTITVNPYSILTATTSVNVGNAEYGVPLPVEGARVTVDGKVVNASAATTAASQLYQAFSLRGLTPAAHSVQIKVLSGTLVVDAIGIVQ